MGFAWDDLKILLALDQAGSLTGAGRALQIDHSTVSRRLAALEAALAMRLVNRGTRGLAWTEVGREALTMAREMEQSMLKFRRGRTARTISGDVRLSAPSGMTNFLAQALEPLREQNTKLSLEIVGENRQADLIRGDADLAVRMSKPTQTPLVSKLLGTVGWGVYGSRAYLRRMKRFGGELAKHDVILYAPSMAQVPGPKWLETNAVGARIVMRTDSTQAAVMAVLDGMGVAVFPCFQAIGQPTLQRVIPDVVASNKAYLVCHEDLKNTPRVRIVHDALVEVFEKRRSIVQGLT